MKGRSLPFTQSERRVAEALRIGMLEVLIRLADSAGEERQRANERQELLIAELNHRVRNILALIRGLVSQTREGTISVEDFVSNLDSRVQALARAHEQVTRDRWGPAKLRDLDRDRSQRLPHRQAHQAEDRWAQHPDPPHRLHRAGAGVPRTDHQRGQIWRAFRQRHGPRKLADSTRTAAC